MCTNFATSKRKMNTKSFVKVVHIFREEILIILQNCTKEQLFNSDQSSLNYEQTSTRTLAIKRTKTIEDLAIS